MSVPRPSAGSALVATLLLGGERIELCLQALRFAVRRGAADPQRLSTVLTAVSDKVQGFKFSRFADLDFRGVALR